MSARNDKKKKTVGELSADLLQSKPPETKVWGYVEEMARDKFIPNLLEAIERGKKMFINRDFFISNAGKNEALMWNVKREYWLPLTACPTPNFDQIVFKYSERDEQLQEVWCIPPEEGCEYLIRNKNKVIPQEQDLLAYTIAFVDGSLERMAKFLNGEKQDAPSLILEIQKDPPNIIH